MCINKVDGIKPIMSINTVNVSSQNFPMVKENNNFNIKHK